MTWYKNGTVTVTNGSPTVTLAGGDAQLNIFPDDGFVGPDGQLYAILSVANATTFTLSTNYVGPTVAGGPYLAVPVADHVQLRDLLVAVNTLTGQYQTITLEAGAGRFPNGTAASPGVKGIDHAGTGLVWNADGGLSISVNGTVFGTMFPGGNFLVNTLTASDTVTSGNNSNRGGARLGVGSDTISGHVEFRTAAGVRTGYVGAMGNAGGAMNFATENGGAYVFSIGNVGFSTLNPLSRIHAFTGTIADLPIPGTIGQGCSVYLTGVSDGYGLAIGHSGSGNNWIQSQRSDGAGATYSLLLNPIGGNVGIGTAAPGARLHTKSTGVIMVLETETPRGAGNCYAQFADSAGPKGYFGYSGVDDSFNIYNNLNTPIHFYTSANLRWSIETNGAFVPMADNVFQIGWASGRVSEIYLGANPIVTSDGREKTALRPFTPAELSAGKRIARIIGIYQWLSAIAEKGDDAREHIGVIAQDVWNIMIDEGLIDSPTSSKYAFLCYDEWDEQTEQEMEEVIIPATDDEPERTEQQPTGETIVTLEAGHRYGIRIDQLTSFLIATQEARLTALEEAQ